MSAYAPYGVSYECADFGLTAFDLPSPLGSLRLYAAGEVERGVVFLHGVGQSWASWTPVLQATRAARIDTSGWVLLDLPGFGDSADLPQRVTLPEVGDAVLAALAAHGLREVTLVGHSMGGFLALDMVARASASQPVPALSGAVVLTGAYAGIVEFVNTPVALARKRPALAAAYGGLWAGSLLGSAPGSFLARFRLGRAAFARMLGLVAAQPRLLPESFIRSLLLEVRGRSFRIAARTGKDYDCSGTWAQIGLPVTAVFGAEDRLVDASDLAVLQSACPSARVVVLEGTGHFTPVERPEDVAELVAG